MAGRAPRSARRLARLAAPLLLCASAGRSTAAQPPPPAAAAAPNASAATKNPPAAFAGVLDRRLGRRQWNVGWQGAIMLPAHRLVVCAPPKTGSTMLMWLMLRVLGHLPPEQICRPELHAPEHVRAYLAKHPFGAALVWNFAEAGAPKAVKAWVHGAWAGALPMRAAPFPLVAAAFSSPNWTTAAQLRDPWWRAVSSYRYQLQSGSSRVKWAMDPDKAADFLFFTRRGKGKQHHAGPMVAFCALHQPLRYDAAIDIDADAHGLRARWAEVLGNLGLDAAALLDTGWEKCTRDGSPALFAPNARVNAGLDQPASSLRRAERQAAIDRALCTPQTSAAVARRFADDYAMLRRQGMVLASAPHRCVHGGGTRAPTPRAEPRRGPPAG